MVTLIRACAVRVSSLITTLIIKRKWLFNGKVDRQTQAVKEKSKDPFLNLRIVI